MNSVKPINTELENRAHQLEVSMVRFIKTQSHIDSDNNISVSDIIDLDNIKELMDLFYESVGLGVGLFDNNFKLLQSAGWQKICTHFHQKHPEAHRACKDSEKYFKTNFQPNNALSYKCNNGLWDIAYPIYIDDEFLGSIFFGQFFLDDDPIEKDFFISQAKKFNFDQDQYIGLLKEVPILTTNKVESFVKFFVKIIENIANVGKL